MMIEPSLAMKISKAIPRLASEIDGEVIATANAIVRVLGSAGLSIHDLASAIYSEEEKHKPTGSFGLSQPPQDFGEMVVLSAYGPAGGVYWIDRRGRLGERHVVRMHDLGGEIYLAALDEAGTVIPKTVKLERIVDRAKLEQIMWRQQHD